MPLIDRKRSPAGIQPDAPPFASSADPFALAGSSYYLPLVNDSDGIESTLILSIDIGTSTSSVAVYYRSQGSQPIVTHVAQWPGQEDTIYEEKVPSLLIYDSNGQLIACGANAASRAAELRSGEGDWSYVQNFKVLLHSRSVLQRNGISPDPLLPNVELLTVYSDFLSFLLEHTRRYLKDTTGTDPWLELGQKAQIILPHPNGWGEDQQRFLRKAAVAAGLVSRDNSKTNVQFVEEAEASTAYFMATRSAPAEQLTIGSRFLLCDAGGSTTDIAAYEVRAKVSSGVALKELGLPSCVDSGGAHVDVLMKGHLFNALSTVVKQNDSGMQCDEVPSYVFDGLRDFRLSGKRRFASATQTSHITIGGRRLNSSAVPIRKGVLTLEGIQMEALFKPSVDKIAADVDLQINQSHPSLIILTGGFGENAYLKQALEKVVGDRAHVVVINSPTSKAVAIGALWLLTDGRNRVAIERIERPWKTMLANIARGFRAMFSRNNA